MPRRLPVIQASADEGPQRPRGQWVLIGGVLSAVLWVPLAALAMPLGARLAARLSGVELEELAKGRGWHPSGLALLLSAGPPLLAFGLSALAAGVLIGRFGAGIRPRDGAASGVVGAFLVIALSWAGGAAMPGAATALSLLLLAMAGFIGGLAGGAWGARKR